MLGGMRTAYPVGASVSLLARSIFEMARSIFEMVRSIFETTTRRALAQRRGRYSRPARALPW